MFAEIERIFLSILLIFRCVYPWWQLCTARLQIFVSILSLHECPMLYLNYVLYLYWYLLWFIIYSDTYSFCLGRKYEVLYTIHSLFISVFSYIFPIFLYIFSFISPTFLKFFPYFFSCIFQYKPLKDRTVLLQNISKTESLRVGFRNWTNLGILVQSFYD